VAAWQRWRTWGWGNRQKTGLLAIHKRQSAQWAVFRRAHAPLPERFCGSNPWRLQSLAATAVRRPTCPSGNAQIQAAKLITRRGRATAPTAGFQDTQPTSSSEASPRF